MNIGDYIREKLSIWSVSLSDELIQIELAKVNLDSSEAITGESNTDEFFYNVIPYILSAPKSVSEGGYSVSYDKEAMMMYFKMIALKLGKRDFLNSNTITDISNRW